MRALKITLIVLLVLIVLVIVGGIIFIKTFDINRYKPQIIAAAQSSLGRTVEMGTMDLEVSLKEGIRLAVHDVTIGEHPAFGKGDFLKLQEAYVGVDLLAYLLKKQVSIAKLSIKSPTVNLILAADGSMNAQTLGQSAAATTPPGDPNAAQPAKSGAPAAALPAVFINELDVTGGLITITDQAQTPPLSLAVKDLALTANGFSFGNPFSFAASAAVFSDEQNLRVEGRAQVNPMTSEVKVSHLKTSVELDSLPLAEIRQLPYIPANTPFPRQLGGELAVTVKELSAGKQGLTSILLDAALQHGEIVIDEVSPGLSVALAEINFAVADFSLNESPFRWNFSAAYLNDTPNISGAGTASVNLATQAVTLTDTTFSTDLALIPFEDLKTALPQLKDVPLPEKLGGKLAVNLKEFTGSAQGIGNVVVDANWTGGEFSMKEVSPGVNVAAKAIDAAVTNFSFGQPFKFSVKAAYLSDVPNMAVEGQGSFDQANQTIHLTDTIFKTDLASVSFAQLKESVASLKEVTLPDQAAGEMRILIKDAMASPTGLDKLLADVNLTDGKIVLTQTPGNTIEASQISFALKDFSLGSPFSFNGKLAAYSELPNVAFDGKGTFDMTTQQITLNDLSLRSDLASISFDTLRQTNAALKDAQLPQNLKGKFDITMPTLAAGPNGLSGLKGRIALTDGGFSLKELPVPVENVDAQILMSNEAIVLPEVKLNIGQGRLSLEGTMTDPLTATPSVDFMTTIGSLNIAQFIDQSKSDVKVEGFLSGGLQISGERIDPKLPMNALIGGGSFKIEKGRLTDINILRMVLDKLNFIPNLRETVEESLPERFKKKLEEKDTILTDVTMDLRIDQGNFFVQPLEVVADGFLFEGNGRAAMDQSFSFEGAFIIPEDLAAAMAEAVPEFELLFDDLNQIRFPLEISGQGSKIAVVPDTNYIMANVVKNKGKQELQKVLNKALGIEDEEEGAAQQPGTGGPKPKPKPQQQPQQKKPEEILIENVLDSIFK